MKIAMIIFIIGLIMLIGGIALAFIATATATWKSKSETLADGKTLSVSAGWISKNENLIDKVIIVDSFETYDYWFGYKPILLYEAKNFAINGSAIEQSSPQIWFNFYVFDSVNFDLWKAGLSYVAFFEAKGKTSINFDFYIATEDAVPDTFYFVVEEYVPLVKPAVRITASINWIEKSPIYDSSEYFMAYGPLIIEESKDFVLKGNASEITNRPFSFYIFDSTSYFDWYAGKSSNGYFEIENVTITSFSVPLSKEEATSVIYFVAENSLVDVNETVRFSATLEWQEKATISTMIGGWILGGMIAFLGLIVIIIAAVVAFVFKPKAPASSTSVTEPKRNIINNLEHWQNVNYLFA